MKRFQRKSITLLIVVTFLFAISGPLIPLQRVFAQAPTWDTTNSKQYDSTSVQLVWSQVSGAIGYKIYRTTDKPGEFQTLIKTIPDGTTTSYMDSPVEGQALYHYEIAAVFDSYLGELSSAFTIRMKDTSPPDSVIVNQGASGPNWVEIQWTPSTSTDVHHYEIHRDSAIIGVLNESGSSVYTYRDVGAVANIAANYFVVTVDKAGNRSIDSIKAAITPPAPSAAAPAPKVPIQNEPTSNDSTKVELTWSSNSEADLAGYQIFRSTTGDVDANYLPYVTARTNFFTDPAMPQGQTCYYKIAAVNTSGTASARSNSVKFYSPAVDDTVPEQPTRLNATSVSASVINLSWVASTAPDVSQYIVWKSDDGQTFLNVGTTNKPFFSVNAGVTANKNYVFRIMAKDLSGNYSAGCAARTVTTPQFDSNKPTTPVDFKTDTIGETYIEFSWKLSKDNVQVDHYEIQMLDGGNYVTQAIVKHPIEHGIIDNLNPKTNYTFQIIAFDNSQNSSEPSAPLAVTTLEDKSPPVILSKNPYDGAAGIPTGQPIKVTFDDLLEPTSVTTASFKVEQMAEDGSTVQTLTDTPIVNLKEIQFNHQAFLPQTTYKVTIDGIRNVSGLTLAKPVSWAFTTGDSEFLKPHGKYTDNTALCNTCHNAHTGKQDNLLNEKDTNQVCYTCHDGTGTKGNGSVFNVGQQFGSATPKTSHHPTDEISTEEGALISCASCHNPHDGGIDLNTGKAKDHIARLLSSYNMGDKTKIENLDTKGKGFCWNCHGKTTAPDNSYGFLDDVDRNNANTLKYPNVIINGNTTAVVTEYRGDHQTYFPATNKGHNSDKMDQYKSYNGSTPERTVTGTDLKCDACHEKHGSDVKPLLRTQISMGSATLPTAITTNGNEFCYQCHTQPIEFAYSDWATETQQNAWDGKAVNEASGHVQFDCQVCHNPHGSQYPNYLRLNYKVDTTAWQSSSYQYLPTDIAICYDCHDETKVLNNTIHDHITKDKATCKDCHRPHGAIADENDGPVNHKVGFPGDAQLTGRTKAYIKTADGGSCSVTCHGYTHFNLQTNQASSYSNATRESGNWSLKANWQTDSWLLKNRPDVYKDSSGTFFRDSNHDGYLWK